MSQCLAVEQCSFERFCKSFSVIFFIRHNNITYLQWNGDSEVCWARVAGLGEDIRGGTRDASRTSVEGPLCAALGDSGLAVGVAGQGVAKI